MGILVVVLGLLTLGGFGASGYFYVQSQKAKDEKPDISEDEAIRISSEKAKSKLDAAESKSQRIIREARQKARKIQTEADELDNQMLKREENLVKREKIVQKKLDDVESMREEVNEQKTGIKELRSKLETRLEKVSGLSRDEARNRLKKEIEEDLKEYHARQIREVEKEIAEESEDKSKEILIEAMQSIATEYVGETTTSTIKVDDDKMKGRIIGRDGRNIRAFEKVTGVDVIVDESPDAIAISSFDPLRREIASIAMKKLISDGRIHPGRVEELVSKAKKDVSKEIKKNGQVLADEAGWPGIDSGLLKLLGKLKYRTSYGQSLMQHTIEVIRLGTALAEEIGADVELVRRACLLHDVGKVLTHKMEGQHHHLSGKIARRYKLPDNLVNAIEAHHLDIEPDSVEAVIVYIADAISGARPGARKDNYESYIKRVEGIEEAAKKVAGKKASDVFAIHAGREVRVIVKPESIDDDEIVILAKKISDKIQETQTYPGTVQVSVIRESRAVSVAK